MNKRLFALFVTVIVLLIGITASTAAPKIDSFVQDQKAKKAASLGAPETPEDSDFYTDCMNKATTQEQKDALNRLKHDASVGTGLNKREALIIIGDLPKDQKRLTLDKAKQIISETKSDGYLGALERFDAVAGAPDFDGGSGMRRIIYFLNDKRTEAIIVFPPSIIDYVIIGEDGKQIGTPLAGTRDPKTTAPVPGSTSVSIVG